MSDPNARAALTPFSAGFYNIGGGRSGRRRGLATTRRSRHPRLHGALDGDAGGPDGLRAGAAWAGRVATASPAARARGRAAGRGAAAHADGSAECRPRHAGAREAGRQDSVDAGRDTGPGVGGGGHAARVTAGLHHLGQHAERHVLGREPVPARGLPDARAGDAARPPAARAAARWRLQAGRADRRAGISRQGECRCGGRAAGLRILPDGPRHLGDRATGSYTAETRSSAGDAPAARCPACGRRSTRCRTTAAATGPCESAGTVSAPARGGARAAGRDSLRHRRA